MGRVKGGLETLFVKTKDGGEGGGLINFPPLKRWRLFERGGSKEDLR